MASRILRIAALLVLALGGTASACRADELVMFQQDGCPYCAAWDRNIGKIYAKTDEAKSLPLRRLDIHATRPAELRDVDGIRFTPTFVIMHCGRESSRITGYLSDDQFWGLLDADIHKIKDAPQC